MKLTIPATLINSTVSRMSSTTTLILANVDVKSSNTGFKDIPVFKNLKEYSDKIVSITKTKESLDLEFNDEFLEEFINVVATATDKIIPKLLPIVDVIKDCKKILKDYDENLDSLKAKWCYKEEEHIEATIKLETQTPCLDEMLAEDMTLVFPSLESVIFRLDSTEKVYIPSVDRTLKLYAMDIVRKTEDHVYELDTSDVKSILTNEYLTRFPMDILEEIRNYYKVSFNKESN